MTANRLRVSAVIYGALALAAALWGVGRRDWLVVPAESPWLMLPLPARVFVSLSLGAFVAVAVVRLTRWLVKSSPRMRALHGEFRGLFGPLTGVEVALFALFSGTAEELFFRGAMQPSFGLVATSVCFGLVHIGPTRTFWIWTAWAVAMGFVFGAMRELTGDIIGSTLAHVWINYENLHFIAAHDPNASAPSSTPYATLHEPRLVNKASRS